MKDYRLGFIEQLLHQKYLTCLTSVVGAAATACHVGIYIGYCHDDLQRWHNKENGTRAAIYDMGYYKSIIREW